MFDKKKFIDRKKYIVPILLFGFGYLVVRVYLFTSLTIDPSTSPIVTDTQSIGEILYNFVSFPFKVFTQVLIPSPQLVTLGRYFSMLIPESISGVNGTTARGIFVEQHLTEVISFLVTILFAGFYKFLRGDKKRAMNRVTLFGFMFVLLNSFVYALSPQRVGIVTIMDSRNLYFPAIGFSFMIVALLQSIFYKSRVNYYTVIMIIILCNGVWLSKQLSIITTADVIRKEILTSIKNEYPDLPSKVIVYTESDTAFYGLPNEVKTFPFQIGFGRTLLVWYQDKENFPRGLLQDNFLASMQSQGYREEDDRGFGYFRDLEEMSKAFYENNLSLDSIIAYRYKAQTNSLTNITSEIRSELAR